MDWFFFIIIIFLFIFLPVFQLTFCRNSVFSQDFVTFLECHSIISVMHVPTSDKDFHSRTASDFSFTAISSFYVYWAIKLQIFVPCLLTYLKIYVIRLNQRAQLNIFSIQFKAKSCSGCLSMELCWLQCRFIPANVLIPSQSKSNSLNVIRIDQKDRNTFFKRSLNILVLMTRLTPLVCLLVLAVMALCCVFRISP